MKNLKEIPKNFTNKCLRSTINQHQTRSSWYWDRSLKMKVNTPKKEATNNMTWMTMEWNWKSSASYWRRVFIGLTLSSYNSKNSLLKSSNCFIILRFSSAATNASILIQPNPIVWKYDKFKSCSIIKPHLDQYTSLPYAIGVT